MNPYQHALDTQRIALNDNGLLGWVKHNKAAILKALSICDKIETMATQGHKVLGIYDDGETLLVPPPHELQVEPVPAGFEIWQDAEEQN